MRLNAILWDIAGLNAIVGLLWKLAATTIIAIATISGSPAHHWQGALDDIIRKELVSPNAIRDDLARNLNRIGDAWRFFTNAPIKHHAKLESWLANSEFGQAIKPATANQWLILEYLGATAASLIFILVLQAWMRRRGQPPEIEALCDRLEWGVLFHRGSAPDAGGGGGSTALALAGSAATLVGVATGGLGFLVLGPLLVAAAQAQDDKRQAADDAKRAAHSEDRQYLLGLIDGARAEFHHSQRRFLATGLAAAVGLVAGNYAARALKDGFGALQTGLARAWHWPPVIEAVVIVLIFVGFVWAAIFGPRTLMSGQGCNTRYAMSLVCVWAAAVVAIAGVQWFHDRILPALTQ